MADIDTGLGWYADQDWLSAAAGAIGSISTGGGLASFVLTYSTPITVAKLDGTDFTLTIRNNQDTVYFGVQYYGSGSIRVCCLSLAPFTADLSGWGTSDGQQNYGGSGNYYCTLQRYTPASSWEWYYPYPNNVLQGDTATTAVRNMLAGLGVLFSGQPISVGETITPYKPEYPMTYTGYYMPNVTPPPGGPKLYFFATTSPSAVYIAWVRDNDEPHNPPIEMRISRSDGVNYSILLGYQAGYPGISYGTLETGSVQEWLVPVFASVFDALDALSNASPAGVTVDFNKSTAGYSVVCMCKWITSYGGDVYCSPVLISSEPNNTLFTRNSSTPSVNNTEHQYQGATFYMRKAPLDTLTGEEELTSTFPIVDLSGVAQTNDTIFAAIAYQSGLTVGYIPSDEDPYAPGGNSGPSEGTPDFTEVSESISPGSTFPISFQSTGLCRVYVPSITDLNDLANYLWTDQTFLDTIKNILINQFENFMEAVISLTMVPCPVPKDTAQPVKVMFLSTGLSFPPATQQFVEVDCGYVDITERYASALDYNPYTKVSLYLPFIGTVPLDTDEVMGHRLKCVYTIDIVSGACVAKIMVDYPDSSNGVLYQFSGHCSISMPLTAADFSSYYAAAMSGLKMAAGLAAAGAGAPGLAGTLLGEPTAHPSSTTTTTRTTERNAATGRQILTGTESRETSHTPGQASFKELATRASVNTVGAVINSKFSVEHSGGFTGNTGFLGVQAPYVIITRPDMCNPDEYGAYNGRPSMMYLYLGNLSGFTQVQNIKLTGISATNPELGEIAELLKTGVIL